jgi:pimeloyl-ACP methyl ester carboxylesterase
MQARQLKLKYQLRDGRQLTYAIFGDPSGIPVIFSHGLSDSRLLRHHDDDLTKRLGVRIISIDQPGVGESSPMPNLKRDRTLLNYAKDIEQLVNHLQIDTFAIAGHSGGAPHAMAVAWYLGKRVTRGILAGPAPPLDGSAPGAREEFPWWIRVIVGISRWFPLLINWVCHFCTWWAKRDIGQYIDAVAKSDRTDSNPETFFCHPNQTQMFQDSFNAGFEQGSIGIRGMMQVAFINKSWGFDIRKDVTQPFDVFAGDLDSVITPPICQKLVNALPNGTFHLWSNNGHYSFVDKKCWLDFWSVLRDEPVKKTTPT